MYSFIINLALILAFGVMVYVLSLGLPRVNASEAEDKRKKPWEKIPLDEIDQAIQKSLDKILRRLKVVVLKADNFITSKLNNSDNKL
ncbi:MAG: hypothetical protein M1153_01575 [Patescibacteria group bacterium]|nr:hypothetical protein [Patescibacteria group bacterium]